MRPVAALLHDIVEDQGGSARLDEVRDRFGDQVAMIVEGCSDRIDEKDELPWRERKERYLAELDSHPTEVLIVSLADKLYNARAVERDYRAYGESFWSRFNGGREGTLWYYTALERSLRPSDARVPHDRRAARRGRNAERRRGQRPALAAKLRRARRPTRAGPRLLYFPATSGRRARRSTRCQATTIKRRASGRDAPTGARLPPASSRS